MKILIEKLQFDRSTATHHVGLLLGRYERTVIHSIENRLIPPPWFKIVWNDYLMYQLKYPLPVSDDAKTRLIENRGDYIRILFAGGINEKKRISFNSAIFTMAPSRG